MTKDEQNLEEIEENAPSQRFLLPLIIGGSIIIIVGIFSLGFITLTTPAPLVEDVQKSIGKDEMAEGHGVEGSPEAEVNEVSGNEGGAFNFDDYSYFTFPLPFVVNFPDGKGMLTLEIAVAIYAAPLRSEDLLEKLSTFMPKMRSAINLVLAEQVYENIDTVVERRVLEEQLLIEVRKIVEGEDYSEPSGISDLHLIKFVAS